MYTHSKEFRDNLTPDLALSLLKDGNERFVKNLRTNRNLLQQVNETADGQYPFATVLSCMDSRTSAELIFDQGLGEIFSIRLAGNVINSDVLGSMEYATAAVGTKLILVLGHTKCGAITGACNNVNMGNLTGLLNKIQPVIQLEDSVKENRTGGNEDFVYNVTALNVDYSIDLIRKQSPIINQLELDGKIKIAGGIYDVETGKVLFSD
jgi:carbonic anhydrase